MRRTPERERSTAGLFAVYAGASLVLVVVLAVVLTASYRVEAQRRGVAEGLSKARLLASTAIVPLLDGRPLGADLPADRLAALHALADRAVQTRDVLRLRLRDTSGHVVFSDDGSGTQDAIEDEALDAAAGEPVALLTRVNNDAVDTGAVGEDAVEVYLALEAGSPARVVGVLETYLPYGPIVADVDAGIHTLYRDLAIGLLVLYAGVFLLAVRMSRGLRSQVRLNRHLAQHDQLTDLPNRAAFLGAVRATLAARGPDDHAAVVAIIDLDRFKEVNDTLGHESGDDLLAEMARRLRGHLRERDCVARLGGDEFGLVLRDAADPASALFRVREIIEAEFTVRGLPLSVASSIGYALGPDDGADAELLLQRADVAMYVAKVDHSGVTRYAPALDQYDASKLALVGEMRRALERDELVLHYQPKVALVGGAVESLEALVRWQHPVHGLLGPDAFLPLVEQTDLIDDLTRWVLDRALADLAALPTFGDHLSVAVNVSARSIDRPELAALVDRSLRTHGVAPSRLVVEVTETALVVDPLRAAAVLGAVSDLGVSISIDDFGVGQTSLGHLATLPIDEIKIDRSFVLDLVQNPTHAAIARSIIDLGRNLGVRVVAEGVESEEVADELRGLGCELAQGWLFARAMPLAALREWLATDAEAESLV